MRLSARLEAIVAGLSRAVRLGDVGTDHALVPLAALERGLVREAIATDRCHAPLEQARARLGDRYAGRLQFRRGDGLFPLKDAACDAVVMAGMGARAMVGILDATPGALGSCQQLILAPNQEPWLIRRWALANSWHMARESVVHEAGRDYPVLRFIPAAGVDPAYVSTVWDDDALCQIGPLLLRERSPDIRAYFARQLRRAQARAGNQGVRERELWQRALDYPVFAPHPLLERTKAFLVENSS